MSRADRIVRRIREEGAATVPVRGWRLLGHVALWTFGFLMWPTMIAIIIAGLAGGGEGPLATAGLSVVAVLCAALWVGWFIVIPRVVREVFSPRALRLDRHGLMVIRRGGEAAWRRPIPWSDIETARSSVAEGSRLPFWPWRTELTLTREGAARIFEDDHAELDVPAGSALTGLAQRVVLPWGLAGGPGSTARLLREVADAARAGRLGGR